MNAAVWALGAMAGTSMDGVDAAMVLTDGNRVLEFGKTGYEPFSPRERDVIANAQGKWPGDDGVSEAAKVVEDVHIRLLKQFEGVDLIGFHGQTLAHDPGGHGTHQAGNGARLARELGVPVVWDFRTADVELGGQGAPLAPFYHFALARYLGSVRPLAFLNLGGIANLTWVDPTKDQPEDDGALVAFDTGPANAPLDDWVRGCGLGNFDRDGDIARRGQADEAIVRSVLAGRFYTRMPPKSLDRGDMAAIAGAVSELSPGDGAATIVEIIAQSVKLGLSFLPNVPARILVCGGGRLNGAIMAALEHALPAQVLGVETAGLDGDMLEAQAFAHLAVRVRNGLATSAPGTTGVGAAVAGGILSTP